jgi:NhaA family Na+:H+ antiporter
VSSEKHPPTAPRRLRLSKETASGALLVAAAALALAWANSPWRATYEALFGAPVGVRASRFAFERDLRFWINDGLMAIFFFTVGLEIKRELAGGQLGTIRRAALPAMAALGGMIVPAGIYLAINAGTGTARGWGIPMATDIAFAVGVLALLGQRVAPALRLTLLALAVIDDVGAVLVIAFVFSSGLGLPGLGFAALGLIAIQTMKSLGVRAPWAYLAPALATWAGAHAAGVHPTLAGVAVGLMTPARPSPGDAPDRGSPLERLEHAFQPWVANGIMPLFALANAGVSLGDVTLGGPAGRVFAGVALGLVLGKPIGVIGFSWIAVRLRAARLPDETSWLGMLVLGLIAGTGFTMSLFMTALALPPGGATSAARLAILAASAAAGIVGVVVGRLVLKAPGSRRDGGH